MAVAAALTKVTNHSIAYTLTDDGGGGAAAAINCAALLAVLVANGISGPFAAFLAQTPAVNNQAVQRSLLLGDASGIASQDMRNTNHCVVEIAPRTADGFYVDADVDAGGTQGEYNATGPAAAGIAVMTIKYVHSMVR